VAINDILPLKPPDVAMPMSS